MTPTDITGWLQAASECTEKLRYEICNGRIPGHPGGNGADLDIVVACRSLVNDIESYRRDCLESPAQRREDARADAYSKRSSDT